MRVDTHEPIVRAVRQRPGAQERQQRGPCQVPVHYQDYLHPAGPARAARYAKVAKLPVERNFQRSIVRAMGVSRMSVAKLAKKAAQAAPPLPR